MPKKTDLKKGSGNSGETALTGSPEEEARLFLEHSFPQLAYDFIKKASAAKNQKTLDKGLVDVIKSLIAVDFKHNRVIGISDKKLYKNLKEFIANFSEYVKSQGKNIELWNIAKNILLEEHNKFFKSKASEAQEAQIIAYNILSQASMNEEIFPSIKSFIAIFKSPKDTPPEATSAEAASASEVPEPKLSDHPSQDQEYREVASSIQVNQNIVTSIADQMKNKNIPITQDNIARLINKLSTQNPDDETIPDLDPEVAAPGNSVKTLTINSSSVLQTKEMGSLRKA